MREQDFEQWVCRRLERWPTMRILEFEHWLRDQEGEEFVPAVHEALRRRVLELVEVREGSAA
jgi:hypothetical protein